MKKLFLFVLALSVCVSAAEESIETKVDGLQAQIDRAMSKAGIHFGGEFRSQFLSSTVDGDATGDFGKKTENVSYTSVDFDIYARPNTALSARAMFRMHQDWRTFFGAMQNPITTRWLSIDGALMDGIIKYNVGDFQKKMTPLTLWSPDLDLLYEPEIFAENRRLAMGDAFVGDNLRSLQGANLEFKAELYPILQELEFGAFGARVATRGTGGTNVLAPGAYYNDGDKGWTYWDTKYDRYLIGTNLATQIKKGVGVGISTIHMFDDVNTYYINPNSGAVINYNTPDATYTGPDSVKSQIDQNRVSYDVFAGRGNIDTRLFMDDDFINAGIGVEGAYSMNRQFYPDENDALKVLDSTSNGMALNIGGFVRVNIGEGNSLKLSLDYLMNDSAFRNDAAQSPTFIQRAILNNENDLSGLGMMNPFDALYRSVFKYSPSQYFGGPKPHTKNAYTNAILSREQIGALGSAKDANGNSAYRYPSVFQTALPGGMATADRNGIVGKLCGSFLDSAVTVGIKAVMVKTKEEGTYYHELVQFDNDGNPLTNHDGSKDSVRVFSGKSTPEFLEFVGGASVDIAKFAPIVGPSFKIGGSFGMYNVKMDEVVSVDNSLMSAFVDYNFYKRFSFLFGYQMLTSVDKEKDTETGTLTFDNLSFGFNYKVADGGSLTAKLGMLSGKYEPKVGDAVKYDALQPEVYLTVKF